MQQSEIIFFKDIFIVENDKDLKVLKR